jgi:hypothetical protein
MRAECSSIYNVKWNGKRGHKPPHDVVAAQRSSFTASTRARRRRAMAETYTMRVKIIKAVASKTDSNGFPKATH